MKGRAIEGNRRLEELASHEKTNSKEQQRRTMKMRRNIVVEVEQ